MAALKPTEFVERRAALNGWAAKEKLLADAIETENLYRGLFARHRESWEIPEVDDPHLGLVDVYKHLEAFRCLPRYAEDTVPRCFELGDNRRPAGDLSVVPSLGEFESSWDCFTESQLRFLNWNNIFAAGGAVSGCLQPLPEKVQSSNWAEGRSKRRKYFHDEAFPGSDVDLFLYGLGQKEAEAKLVEIFEAVQAANPYEVICFRSAYAVTLVSQYPFRHIQIVLRLYNSPAEVLMGFDVDSCACGYDGKNVYVCQRTAIAFAAQANTVDMSRRSPSYEMRLSKYAERGFEVLVPSLARDRVDPFIYEKRFDQVQGLARLLLLERLRTPEARFQYRMEQRLKKATMKHQQWRIRRELQKILRDKHELASHESQQVHAEGAELSDYSTVFLPWGPRWTALKIRGVMAKKDRVLNTVEFKPGGRVVKCTRKYRLHICAFGAMDEVVKDPFPNDPPIPDDVPTESLAQCVHGRVSWLVDNPGRQQIGSFNPITDGNWMEGAHLSNHLEEIIARCAANDGEALRDLLSDKETDVTALLGARDFLGRSPLHVATLANAAAASRELLQSPAAGASLLEARLADGRFALHLAAMHGFEEITKLILGKRLELAKQSVGEGVTPKPEEIFDIDGADWEAKLSPLQYAVLFGHEGIIEELLKAGADARKPAVYKDAQADNMMYGGMPTSLSHSTLALCAKFAGDSRKLDEAARIAKMLMAAGASTMQVSTSFRSIYHDLAEKERDADVLELMLGLDASKSQVIDVLDSSASSALVLATRAGNAEAVRILLRHGAQARLSDEEYASRKRRADATNPKHKAPGGFGFFAGFHNPAGDRADSLNSSPILIAVEMGHIDCLKAFLEHNPELLQTQLELKGHPAQSLLDIAEDKKVHEEHAQKNQEDTNKQTQKQLKAAEEECKKHEEGSYSFMLWSRELWKVKYRQRPNNSGLFGVGLQQDYADEQRKKLEAVIELLKEKGVARLHSTKDEELRQGHKMSMFYGFHHNMPGQGEPDPLQDYAEMPPQERHRSTISKLPKGEQGAAHRLFQACFDEDDVALSTAMGQIPVAITNSAGATPLWLAVLRGNLGQVEKLWQTAKDQLVKVSKAAPSENMDMAGQLRFMNNLDLAAGITPQDSGASPEEIRKQLAEFGSEVMAGPDKREGKVTSQVSPIYMLFKRADVPVGILNGQEGLVDRIRELSKKNQRFAGTMPEPEEESEKEEEPLEDYVCVSPIEVALLRNDVQMFRLLLRFAAEEAGARESKSQASDESQEPGSDQQEEEEEEEEEDCDEGLQVKAGSGEERFSGKDIWYKILKMPNESLGQLDVLRLSIFLDQPKAFDELAAYAEELILPTLKIEAWRKETESKEEQKRAHVYMGRGMLKPLDAALQFGSKECVRHFAQGVSPSILSFLQREVRTSKSQSQYCSGALMARQWLHKNIKKGQITLEEVNNRLFSLESTDPQGRTTVFYADASTIKELLPFQLNLEHQCSTEDQVGGNALMMASYRSETELMSALIDAGCSVTATGGGSWNALHCAVVGVRPPSSDKPEDVEKSLAAVRLLLSRPEAPELLFAEGCEHTPLMLAARRGVTLTRLLAEATAAAGDKGVEALARRDGSLRTALHLGASLSGESPGELDDEALKVLIDVGATNKRGSKAEEALSATVEDGSGMTPLQLVMEKVAQVWSQVRHGHGYPFHPHQRMKKQQTPAEKAQEKLATRERRSLDVLYASAATRKRTMVSFSQVQETVKRATDAPREPHKVRRPPEGFPIDLDTFASLEGMVGGPNMQQSMF